MPLDFDQFLNELQSKEAFLRGIRSDTRDVANRYLGALGDLDPSTSEDTEGLGEWPGATVEEDGSMFREVSFEFRSDFLGEALDGCIVTAIDGSQVKPDESFDIPVGVANCALVRNDYGAGEQDVERRQDLLVPDGGPRGDPYSGEEVKTRRDLLELKLAKRAVEEGPHLVLFDNSLVPNHVNYKTSEVRERYVEGFVDLLRASEAESVPVVGFLDSSRAGDLLNMLKEYTGEKRAPYMTDARLLVDVMEEGQRTKAFRVKRKDVVEEPSDDEEGEGRKNLLEEYTDAGYGNGVCTAYLHMGGEQPGRIEFPTWVLEEGLLDDVVGMVVGEALRGERYPHVLMEAHDAAVIRKAESENVHRAVERHVNRRINQKEFVKRRK
ncbi:MAG: hypothetical protein MAG715_00859 [Methanonatronarchaeales archaeon]|nr:hypothetical protein [Methanonatronarchaeales archaeon]